MTSIIKCSNGIRCKLEHQQYDLTNSMVKEILTFLKQKEKLNGVKYLKNQLHIGLKECKWIIDTIEMIENSHGWYRIPENCSIIIESPEQHIPEDAFLYG